MPDQWIVRVEGQEYGPVDTDALRDWRREGRLIPANELRRVGDERWIRADQLVEVFADPEPAQPPPLPPPSRSLWQIMRESFRIYLQGVRHFLVLTLLTALPSFCAQLSAPTADVSTNVVLDLRAAMAGMFFFLMLLLGLAMWPVFIAGIQVATADILAARPLKTFDLLRRAIGFWPRVALLCVVVYGSFFLWTAVPVFLILVITVAGPSVTGFFLALLLLGFQVWITARLFTNFLFWQQFAVIEGSGINETLRQSKELARSGQDRPWYSRPLWRGAVLASLWCVLVLIVSIGPEWGTVRSYFHELTTQPDPQAMFQALSNLKPHSAGLLNTSLGLLQIVLRPLLGISFVVLYFDAKARSGRIDAEKISSK
jgi:hypothetical protein